MSASEMPSQAAAAPGPSNGAVIPPQPPSESPQETWTRRAILTAFWAVVIFLGLPHWIWTTTVYRSDLPVDRMTAWDEGNACDLRFPIQIDLVTDGADQLQLDTWSSELSHELNTVNGEHSIYRFVLNEAHEASPATEGLTVKVTFSQDKKPLASLQSFGTQLDVTCDPNAQVDPCLSFTARAISQVYQDEQAAVLHHIRKSPFGRGLATTAIESSVDLEKRQTRAFKYASSYHLTFSLFAATASPSSWEIQEALQEYIYPLVQTFSTISNFTIDTQVQLFSSLSSSIDGPRYDANSKTWTLSHADLSGFINAAEWPLSPSIDAGPTINLVLYIPSPDMSPMVVSESSTNSWIIPQWGGVKILNRAQLSNHLNVADLEDAMITFADQLASLVGIPTKPASLQLRVQSLVRERATSLILSASSTLGALVRLTNKLDQIAIPTTVAHAVSSSLTHLDQACSALQNGKFQTALGHARVAEESAEKAFFEPSMVGQVYFPDEHKVAVYVPLLGPMAVPLLLATLKEIKQFRQRKVKTS